MKEEDIFASASPAPGASVRPEGDPPSPERLLSALRELGAEQVDPVRFRFLSAMAQRRLAYQGLARQSLDEKLLRLLHDHRQEIAPKLPASWPAKAIDAAFGIATVPGPVAELVDRLTQRSLAFEADAAAQPLAAPARHPKAPGPDPGGTAHIRDIDYFRRTWSKLHTDQRLAQSESTLPENAGPLNSRQLVHRALSMMRNLSPAYLERFVSHVDALLWVSAASQGRAKEAGSSPRTEKPSGRKPRG